METYRSKATASMVLGIISLSLLLLFSLAGLICGIIALVFGIQLRKAAELEQFELPEQAKAGFVMGIIGVALNGLIFVACVACFGAAGSLAGAPSGLSYFL